MAAAKNKKASSTRTKKNNRVLNFSRSKKIKNNITTTTTTNTLEDEDFENVEPNRVETKENSSVIPSAEKKYKAKNNVVKPKDPNIYDKKYCQYLEKTYPTSTNLIHTYSDGMLKEINARNSLKLINSSIQMQGETYSISFTNDHNVLVNCSILGEIGVHDLEEHSCLQRFRDEKETAICEYFTTAISYDDRYVFAGGKRKDRKKWCYQDEDNYIMPCHIKVFDILTGECVEELKGHEEEIMFVNCVTFKGDNYVLSGSQDGTIIKWRMNSEWNTCLGQEQMLDDETCMVFHISVLPNCGSKYFMAACDSNVKIFDFETRKEVAVFRDLFGCYCDYALPIINPDMPMGNDQQVLFLTRGVENVDEEGLSVSPNKVQLYQLQYPKNNTNDWSTKQVREFKHEDYYANSFMCRLATNGYYVVAPTVQSTVYVWNIKTGALVAVIKAAVDDVEKEVRDIKFHPSLPRLYVTGDDGIVKVYGLEEEEK